MNPNLSPEMKKAFDFGQANGGKLIRHPGGFWCGVGLNPGTSKTFGTTTVEALVKRKAAEYTTWKDNRSGKFPVEATMTPAQPPY